MNALHTDTIRSLKNHGQTLIFIFVLLLGCLPTAATELYASPQPAWLQQLETDTDEPQPVIKLDGETSSPRHNWAFAFDNDFLVPGHRDQDYTYGLNFTRNDDASTENPAGFNKLLMAIDKRLGNQHKHLGVQESYSREIGAFGFTPEDITLNTANTQDRPYASLVYLAANREQIDLVENVAWKSTLTIGVLGLGVIGEMQNLVHAATDGKQAQGWQHQISNGGEFTARYVIARQGYFDDLPKHLELKSTAQASLGYLTEASWGLNLRAGRIHSPWASFNPELASYGEKSSYLSSAKAVNEHYFWLGFSIKARAYNAFLQGQFRDSTVTYAQHQLRPWLVEAWAGYTLAFKNGYRISYLIRGHSSEIKQGYGDRNLLWGGIIVARNL